MKRPWDVDDWVLLIHALTVAVIALGLATTLVLAVASTL